MKPITTYSKRTLITALVAGGLLLGIAPIASASNCTGEDAHPNQLSQQQVSRTTLCLLNNRRADHGMRALRLSSRLGKAARGHSADMARRGYFSHDSRSGGSFVERIRSAGYLGQARSWKVGENIAWGTGRLATPGSIVTAWMHSPGHRANILNPAFRELGVGVTDGAPVRTAVSSGATYTTDFGTRG
jgi:uncharacterized protein YkwD